jgi:GT2 family glycosyltransferase
MNVYHSHDNHSPPNRLVGYSYAGQNVHLSIIIVNWNTRDLLDACLRSIQLHANPILHEIIVYDNHSADGSAEMVRQKYPGIILVAGSENIGFGPANNLALDSASGEYILLLNPDTEIRADTLQTVLQLMEDRSDLGICGVRQDEASGAKQSSCGNFPSLWVMLVQQMMFIAARRGRLDMVGWMSERFSIPLMPVKELLPYFHFDSIVEVDWVMGAFMMVKRSAVPPEGLFDERFVMYGEDLDLCARVRKNGFLIAYCGTASILHHGGASTKSVPIMADAMHSVAMVHFYRKHHPFTSLIYQVILAMGSLVLFLKATLAGEPDQAARGLARFRAAICPSWTRFLVRY